MATIIPFKAIRPSSDKVHLVASRSMSTYTKVEMESKLATNPFSFLHVLKPDFGHPFVLKNDSLAYLKMIKQKFQEFLEKEILIQDQQEGYYVYRQFKNGISSTGIIGCIAIADYFNGIIKRHEDTLTEKEEKLRDYLEIVDINAEPVCFAYEDHPAIKTIIDDVLNTPPACDFSTTNEIRHQLWSISDSERIEAIGNAFKEIPSIYIADGHHRSASSCLLGSEIKSKKEEGHTLPTDYFMGIFIPESQLHILDFNRVVKDLNGKSAEAFIADLSHLFHVQVLTPPNPKPEKMHQFTMYLNGQWYALDIKSIEHNPADPVSYLDAALLTELVLQPLLGINDIRNDKRIGFVGGHEGMERLKQLVDDGKMKVAFGLFPVTMEHLKKIADAGQVMPPKSTWIEPKLRSGLTIYSLTN
jgi:uncharacterized protein (DUF1015 family)